MRVTSAFVTRAKQGSMAGEKEETLDLSTVWAEPHQQGPWQLLPDVSAALTPAKFPAHTSGQITEDRANLLAWLM